MAATTTSLSNAIAACLLMMMSTAQAALVDCPRLHTDETKNAVLTSADLFQGPPEGKASMIPDLETSVWELDGYQQNSEARGETLYLVCHYRGIKATVSIEVPRQATFCKVQETVHGTVAFCGATTRGKRQQRARHG